MPLAKMKTGKIINLTFGLKPICFGFVFSVINDGVNEENKTG
jgi:hypothetical protein